MAIIITRINSKYLIIQFIWWNYRIKIGFMKGKIPKKSKNLKGWDFIKFLIGKYDNSYLQEISNYIECKIIHWKKEKNIILIDNIYNA